MNIDQAKQTLDHVLAVIASWKRECAVCAQTFIPTNKHNARCLDCQMENRYGRDGE